MAKKNKYSQLDKKEVELTFGNWIQKKDTILKRVQAEINKELKVKTGTSQSKNSREIISKMNQDNIYYLGIWKINYLI